MIKVAQTNRVRMRGIQELGGVLEHQNRIGVLAAGARGVGVSSANALSSNLLGVQKAIGGLGGSPRATGLRNAGGRVGELVSHDADKTLGEAGIAQVGRRQFLSSPGMVIWEQCIHHVRISHRVP